MIALLYDDRFGALAGLKLAVASLRRHCPELPLWVLAPGAPASFASWCARIAGLDLDRAPEGLEGRGWSVKPAALALALARGHEEVLWVDSDIVVTGDLLERLQGMDPGALVLTEEYHWGHAQGGPARTLGLGLEVGRTFACTLNTGIMRIRREHGALLEAWRQILASPPYLEAQRLPVAQRRLEYASDQEVLTGLLGSRGFAHVPVELLRRGRDIAQCFGPSGFTPFERLRCGTRLPLVVHAMGPKPWVVDASRPASGGSLARRLLSYYQRVHLELSPYVGAARPYRDELEEDTTWMEPRTLLGRVLHGLVPVPVLEELPLSVLDSLQRRFRRMARIGQMRAGPSRR